MSDLKDFIIKSGGVAGDIGNDSTAFPHGLIVQDGVLLKYTGAGGDLIIPEGVTEIDSFVFENCATIDKLILPNNLTIIGEQAFTHSNIKTAYIPNIEEMGSGAFEGCEQLNEVIMGDSIEKIADVAFMNCISLSKIIFPKKLKTIEDGAFLNCKAIERLELPITVTSIGKQAFDNCSLLEFVSLPDKITTIGSGAFARCHHLKELNCNETVLRIFLDSFNAKNLFDITYKILMGRLKITASVDEKFIKYIRKNHLKIFSYIAESDNEYAFTQFVKYMGKITEKEKTKYNKILSDFSYAEHVKKTLSEL